VPNVNPNDPNPVGATTTPDAYPQWGVKQISGKGGQATSTKDYSVTEVKTAAQKTTLLKQGYDAWFSSENDANTYVSGQVDNANNPANKAANKGADAISSVTDFLKGIASGNLWIRVAKVAIGGALLIIGIAEMTGAGPAAVKTAVKVAPFL
jgi:hypothetical protein